MERPPVDSKRRRSIGWGCYAAVLAVPGFPVLAVDLLIAFGGSPTAYAGIAAILWAVIGFLPLAGLLAYAVPRWPFGSAVAVTYIALVAIAVNESRRLLGSGVHIEHVDDLVVIPLQVGFVLAVATCAYYLQGAATAEPEDAE